MSDKDAGTPRLFLMRHGETSWSRSGHYTGVTDLPLLPDGEARVLATARHVYGAGKLIDPAKLTHVFVSPRQRARRTLELLGEEGGKGHAETTVTDDIAEWGYGDYEGKLTGEIRALRTSMGLDATRPWDIWRDGCTGLGGESAAAVSARLDRLISQIKQIHRAGMAEKRACDVLVVAHGHILRAFVKRWLAVPMSSGLSMMLEPGGVCGLSYQHGSVEEPAVLVGMSFPG